MIVPEGSSPGGSGSAGDHGVTITTHDQHEAVVVAVSGEVDMLTAPQVQQAVMTVLDTQPLTLVIDLVEVTFFGSSGLAVLVEAQQRAGEQTQLRVVAAGSAIMRPLQLTGLDRQLSIHATRADALAS